MTAYYNEFDPYAAQWLRNLIAAGHIAPGVVDERSIEDVVPSDLEEFTQCHFFAGVGVWSLALRRAGWPDDRPVWTGSCPCQPFSAAGAGAGFSDPRHLWPTFAWLIKQRRPPIVFGEQVASKDAEPWLDLVQADLEAMVYAFGAIAFPSAGVGAPHIRDRTYWVANADSQRQSGTAWLSKGRKCETGADRRSGARGLCHASSPGLEERERFRGILGGPAGTRTRETAERAGIHLGRLADTTGERWQKQCPDSSGSRERSHPEELEQRSGSSSVCSSGRSAGPINGLWADADWLFCRDGKWRPVEPGTFPLAHGATSRVGRLRAYGNAINAEAARVFIEAVMECQS